MPANHDSSGNEPHPDDQAPDDNDLAWDEPSSIGRMPKSALNRLLHIRICKGDGEQVREILEFGADATGQTKRGTPFIVRATRGNLIHHTVVAALLANGADPFSQDALGRTAIDHVQRRLAMFEGKPRRKPRQSGSLDEHGNLKLPPWELEHLQQHLAENPETGQAFVDEYMRARRKAAARTFDSRAELEKMVPLLERAMARNNRSPGG